MATITATTASGGIRNSSSTVDANFGGITLESPFVAFVQVDSSSGSLALSTSVNANSYTYAVTLQASITSSLHGTIATGTPVVMGDNNYHPVEVSMPDYTLTDPHELIKSVLTPISVPPDNFFTYFWNAGTATGTYTSAAPPVLTGGPFGEFGVPSGGGGNPPATQNNPGPPKAEAIFFIRQGTLNWHRGLTYGQKAWYTGLNKGQGAGYSWVGSFPWFLPPGVRKPTV